jgi:hypothetical protein
MVEEIAHHLYELSLAAAGVLMLWTPAQPARASRAGLS